MANAKKPTTKKATTKRETLEEILESVETADVESVEEVEEAAPVSVASKPVERPTTRARATRRTTIRLNIDKEEQIACSSAVEGQLIYVGSVTGNKYIWQKFGDTITVEFQDLQREINLHKDFIYKPYIIIDDEEILEAMPQLEALYNNLFTEEDLIGLINAPINVFKREFVKLPQGLKDTVVTRIASMVDRGQFDSMGKIKFIDEVCGTCLVQDMK